MQLTLATTTDNRDRLDHTMVRLDRTTQQSVPLRR